MTEKYNGFLPCEARISTGKMPVNDSNSSSAGGCSSNLNSTPSTTVVKYKKSSCLFCNEWFDSQTFTEHLLHCGQVFESCPKGCNAYVARIRMRAHLKECPRVDGNKLSRSCDQLNRVRQSWSDLQSCFDINKRQETLEQDIDALRVVLNEEIRQRLHLITDVGSLRKQNQIIDDWMQSAQNELNNVRKCLEEEFAQRCFEMEQCQQDFRTSYDMVQALKNEVQYEIIDLQKQVNAMSSELTKYENLLNKKIVKIEDKLLRSEENIDIKLKQMNDFLTCMANDFRAKDVQTSDFSAKQATLDYEVKSMKNIVCDTEERCEKLESVTFEIEKRLCHTMQALNDLENHLATRQRLASIDNTRGHIIWRIKDYSKKLEEAKRFDTIMHSVMFSNKQFGYALRLDIHLNGKGSWKGRNMISSLNVIAGEYDELLAWPCRLQADIIIRDQCRSSEDSKDYVKTINVRKKSDECFQTNQYFHIPHKVINSRNYIRNDCLFVEVKVHKS